MGQTMLSALMIIVVTIGVINANRLVIMSTTTKMEALAHLQAPSIAMEVITEARLRRFDEINYTNRYMDRTEFTTAANLGPDAGESFTLPDVSPYQSLSKYDDFDDFNGYRRTVNTAEISGYTVSCTVFYAANTSPDANAGARRYVKTLKVTVTHPQYLTTPAVMSLTRVY